MESIASFLFALVHNLILMAPSVDDGYMRHKHKLLASFNIKINLDDIGKREFTIAKEEKEVLYQCFNASDQHVS